MRVLVLPMLLLAAACSTTEPQGQVASPEDDPRVGQRVNRICFRSAISDFSEWDAGEGIVLRRGANKRFLVTFTGVCPGLDFPRFVGLGPDQTQAGCLRETDRLYISDGTRRGVSAGSCIINRIYEFDPTAEAPIDAE